MPKADRVVLRGVFLPALLIKRFRDQVDRRGPDECWPWTGTRNHGYGVMMFRRVMYRANRLAVLIDRGPIPPGFMACHTCDNRPCCNPAHLYVGTAMDNSRDAVERDRRPRGDSHWARRNPDLVRRGPRPFKYTPTEEENQ